MSNVPYPFLALASSTSTLVTASGSTLHHYNASSSSSSSSQSATDPDSSTSTSLIRFIALSPDSTHAATLSDDKSLRVYSLSAVSPPQLLSTRHTTKKGSCLTFTPSNDILLSDKTGDAYLYPFHPRTPPSGAERPAIFALVNDPYLNPDATHLLGHVSVLTAHTLSPDGRHLITADRDEHIRISRFPQTYVIERYLLGSSGFVSALHIPASHPNLLLSAGGENALRIWDWQTGALLGKVEIWSAVLPHRRVRSAMRTVKGKGKRVKGEEQPAHESVQAAAAEETFYSAPEGYMLPSGQGVLVKKIESVDVGDGRTAVLFFSEGAAAVHSFMLPPEASEDASASAPPISTLALPAPVLAITALPDQPRQFIASLDTAWDVLKANEVPGQTPAATPDLTDEQASAMSQRLAVFEIATDGTLSDVTSSATSLLTALTSSPHLTTPQTLRSLNLYPDLFLYPRWPGFEEDDEEPQHPQPASNMLPPTSIVPPSRARTVARSVAGSVYGAKRDYTREELEGMNAKALGRLKSQGVDVGDLLAAKNKERKEGKKRRRMEVLGEGGEEEEAA